MLLALARRPKLLVLDESTTGLDPAARHEILRELTDVMLDEDRSVLFSSHNTQHVEQISDTITFIDRGKIIDSMDKEIYLDRWRRLRLEVPSGITLPALPGIIGVKQDGRLAVATANAFVPDLANAYENTGARVQRIETMTLEEIFVANVEHSREEITMFLVPWLAMAARGRAADRNSRRPSARDDSASGYLPSVPLPRVHPHCGSRSGRRVGGLGHCGHGDV
jgi:ABC-2 type transport system ATP-binding protein